MLFNSKSVPFDLQKDIPPLDGKVILVTGGNSGLGKQSVLELSRHKPAQIWLTARNLEKARAAEEEIRLKVPEAPIKLLELDLASFDSIKKAAKIFLAETDRLDILMLNAGIMATPPGLTKDGYELQFGTNHMGHALLTELLLPLLLKTSESSPDHDVRVVSLSSTGHAMLAKGAFNFDTLKTKAEAIGGLNRYFQSKLANVLFAKQLAKLYPQLTVAAVHPGVVNTNLAEGATSIPKIVEWLVKLGKCLLTSVDQGVKNQLWACVSKDVKSGEYYQPVGVSGKVSDDGKDAELAERLWEWTQAELKLHLA